MTLDAYNYRAVEDQKQQCNLVVLRNILAVKDIRSKSHRARYMIDKQLK